MAELELALMAEDRGLLTDREREILTGEAAVSDSYRYRVISRVRNKIERIRRDREILKANHESLYEEFCEAACEGENNE